MMTSTKTSSGSLSWLPGAAAVLAFIACNGLFVLVAIFSLFGIAIVVNPHIQAAVISLFALLTLGFVVLNYRQHRVAGPVIMSVIGAVIIISSMYIYFNKIVESIGLLALIVSAVWSWRASKTCARQ